MQIIPIPRFPPSGEREGVARGGNIRGYSSAMLMIPHPLRGRGKVNKLMKVGSATPSDYGLFKSAFFKPFHQLFPPQGERLIPPALSPSGPPLRVFIFPFPCTFPQAPYGGRGERVPVGPLSPFGGKGYRRGEKGGKS